MVAEHLEVGKEAIVGLKIDITPALLYVDQSLTLYIFVTSLLCLKRFRVRCQNLRQEIFTTLQIASLL